MKARVAMTMRGRLTVLAGAVLATLAFGAHGAATDSVAGAAADSDETEAEREPPLETSDRATYESGVRVYVDPETGRRTARGSEEARRALEAASRTRPEFSQSSEGLVERPAPGGGVIVDLQGRFQSSTQVRIGAGGVREMFCNDPLHGAPDHRHEVAPATGREER